MSNICPKCGKGYSERPALSRKDNKTDICPACGMWEAITAARMAPVPNVSSFKFRVWDILSKKMLEWGNVMNLPAWEIFPGTPEQRAFNVMRFTEKRDRSGREIYEGDIIENHFGIKMKICYGTYPAYCPADECYMDSVGFYVETPGYPMMPIGPLDDYAMVVGNIYETSELMEM
ncbi:MAG: YopX family protein [Lachnospiraceae bacterium]